MATKDGSTGAYLVADLHGNTALAEASGSTAVMAAIRYDGYGQTLDTHAVTGSISLDTKYQGRLDLSATDDPLYDLSARLYAPGLGTFTSLDSVMGSAQDPASLNRFLYAEANPTTFTDPTGHRVCEAYCEESAPRASETKHERAVGARAGKQRQRRQTERTKDSDSRTGGGADDYNTKTIAWVPPSLQAWLNFSEGDRAAYIANHVENALGWDRWASDDASIVVYWILMEGAPWVDQPSTFERFDDATIDRLSEAVWAAPPSLDIEMAGVTFRFGGNQNLGAATLAPSGMQVLGGASLALAGSHVTTGVPPIPSIKAGSAGGATAFQRFSQNVRGEALADNPGTCVYCRMWTDTPEIDHVIPRSAGGNATIQNAQVTCIWCNRSKGSRPFPVNPPPDYVGPFPPPWWRNR